MINSLEQFAARGLKAQQSADAILASLDPLLVSCLKLDELEDHLRSKTTLKRADVDKLLQHLRKVRAK